MSENVQIVFKLPKEKVAGDISFFLPKENKLESDFCMPIEIAVKNAMENLGDTVTKDHIQRVYTHSGVVENIDPLISRMCDLLASFCNVVLQKLKANDEMQLLYVANIGEEPEFISSILGQIDFSRFQNYYIGEVQQIQQNTFGTNPRLCLLEATSVDFDFIENECFPGDIVLGGVLLNSIDGEDAIFNAMKMDFICKEELNNLLGDDSITAFWFCSTDFDYLTMWHKKIPGEKLIHIVKDILKRNV